MNYKNKFWVASLLVAISLAMILGLTYVLNLYFSALPLILMAVIFPLVGLGFTYGGVRTENKFLLILSILLYNFCFSSVAACFYVIKDMPINMIEFAAFTGFDFILLSVIYCFASQFKNSIIPGILGLVMIGGSAFFAYNLFQTSYVSEYTIVYSIVIGVFTILHYLIAIATIQKNMGVLKAMSIGYGYIFWIAVPLVTDGVAVLPDIEDNSNSNE